MDWKIFPNENASEKVLLQKYLTLFYNKNVFQDQ